MQPIIIQQYRKQKPTRFMFCRLIVKLYVCTPDNSLVWNTTLSNEFHTPTGRPGVGLKFKLGDASEENKWAGISAISSAEWENQIDLVFSTFNGSPYEKMRINSYGNVGIGTSNPTEKLEVNGNIRGLDVFANRNSLISWYNINVGCSHSAIVMNGNRKNNTWNLYGDGARSSIGVITTDIFSNMYFATHHDPNFTSGKTMTDEELINNNTKMLIAANGNVGIGINNPTEKLDVNGTIRAKEIKVEATPWPDFVFADNYTLRDLSEVEAFIKENKHLPEIPSAAAMEANGVNLAEMNRLLLQKIEELTLYSIVKEKEVTSLKSKVETQEERLAKIEALLMNTTSKE